MYFRSESEIALAEKLSHCGLTFFANVRGLINTQPSVISHQQATGRLEIDFFVFHKGKCISVEVDGNHHREVGQTIRDYTRDRLLLREQIPTARFTAEECYKQPALVVKEIVALFN
jgi:very-short-patch-repair endonuclease